MKNCNNSSTIWFWSMSKNFIKEKALAYLKYNLWTTKTVLVCTYIIYQTKLYIYNIQNSFRSYWNKERCFNSPRWRIQIAKPSYTHFTEEVHKTWPKEFRLGLPRSSKLKAHRSLRDSEGFLIRHFAGAVCYQTVIVYLMITIFVYNSSS